MSPASLRRLASAARCCTDAVALVVPWLSIFTATVVSQYLASHTWPKDPSPMMRTSVTSLADTAGPGKAGRMAEGGVCVKGRAMAARDGEQDRGRWATLWF